MRIPVIIAAHNEATYISRTLDALPLEFYEPIVVANGCTDATAEVAFDRNATVIEAAEAAKLPALQIGVKSLGGRALEGFLLTDADSLPILPKYWGKTMIKMLPKDRGGTVAGPLIHIDGKFQDCLYNSVSIVRAQTKRWYSNETFMCGNNMAVRLHTDDALDEFLRMPNIWPGEDAAISKMVYKHGGFARQLVDPRALVMTSTRYAPKLSDRIRLGAEATHMSREAHYIQRAPQGSRPLQPNSRLGY